MATADILSGADTSPLSDATYRDRRKSDEFYAAFAKLQQQYEQQLAAQNALGRSFDRTISGQGPSVAGTSLERGLNQTQSAISAEASGASGQNAGVMQYGAIQALAAAHAKAQQDAAVARAQEVQQAQQAKGALLNQQQGATANMAGVTVPAGTALSGQNTTGSGALVNASEEEAKQRRALAANLMNSFSTAATAYGTS